MRRKPSSGEVHHMTRRGYTMLLDELTQLTTIERPKACEDVQIAAAHGDRSENAEYKYGKQRLREIDRRMRYLRKRLDAAVVVDPREDRGDRVFFGATVELEDLDTGAEWTYQLVGSDEIDPDAGLISYRSPVGLALLGKELDDEVLVVTPKGRRELLITSVEYK